MSIPTEPAAQTQGIIRWSGVHWPIASAIAIPAAASVGKPSVDLLQPLRSWLDQVRICNAQQAHKLCRLIPSQCPFERDIKVFGRTLLHIPPLCKFNPLYDELIALRFRALCYLADECGEDISAYC
ncbi:Mo-dependent nitrogenase C-terminal domain-containing protein [Trichothermofontia sp.]